MSEIKLLPCPICNGEVAIALNGDSVEQWYSITRGFGENKCNCRLFMESEKFDANCTLGTRERAKNNLVKAWNTRKPMERIAERVHDITKVYLDARNPEESAYVVRKMDVINILKEEGGIE